MTKDNKKSQKRSIPSPIAIMGVFFVVVLLWKVLFWKGEPLTDSGNLFSGTEGKQVESATAAGNNFSPQEVDCNAVAPVEPVNFGLMTNIVQADQPYTISYAWWERRMKKPSFQKGEPSETNGSIRSIQKLLVENPNGVFIDVGANVGFMCNFATQVLQRPTYAIEPISYNVAKVCEAERKTSTGLLHLYHAAAGPTPVKEVSITRPSDKIGYFDQSSLSREAVHKSEVIEELIPLVTVDSIIPHNVDIAGVKIDVQGHEIGVLKGMKEILAREQNYPKFVFYEDQSQHIIKAGNKVGECRTLLESYGYTCDGGGGDVLCQKK